MRDDDLVLKFICALARLGVNVRIQHSQTRLLIGHIDHDELLQSVVVYGRCPSCAQSQHEKPNLLHSSYLNFGEFPVSTFTLAWDVIQLTEWSILL